MTSVLVLGVGFIGFNVACTLKREGYKVFGLSILEEDRAKLYRNEIIPIIGDVSKGESTWLPLVESEIDIVIECISSTSVETPKIVQDLLIVCKQKKPNLKIIFTNASFLLGSSDNDINEKQKRIDIQGFRHAKEIEENYLKMGATIVIPSMVYGLNQSYCSYYFECVKQSFKNIEKTNNTNNDTLTSSYHKIKTYGNEKYKNGFYQGFIHISDLCRFYSLVVKNSNILKGESLIANGWTEKCDDLLKAIYKCHLNDISAKSETSHLNEQQQVLIEFVEPPITNSFLLGMTFNQRLSYSKATTLIGYYPLQPSFISSIDTYYNSWKFANDSNLYDFISSTMPKY